MTAIAYPGKVRLRWPKAPIGVAAYSVYRSASTGGPWEMLTPDGPKQAENWRDNVFAAVAQPDAPMYYKVAALNRAGAELAASEPVICAALPGSALQPILSLDLANGLSGGSLNGSAVIEKVNDVPVIHFTNGGYLAFPHRPEFNTDQEITVSLWVKLVSLGNMPVVLSHGQFDVDGYFVQVFGGRIRFYLHGVGLVDAGGIQPGKWYHIAGTYDGSEIAVYLNGERVGRAYANGSITPCGRTLYIGRYEHSGPEYETECLIAGVRIYPTGLPGDEVRKEYLRLSDKLR
ncbi:MAG: LamG domain-containing protein [Armatimonadetes bacterium]|nr:LamG domain-containing protein [Armatimonadota bacterium]